MPGRKTSMQGERLKIVAIGGGTGLSSLLHGLKAHIGCLPDGQSQADLEITAVVTVTDDGGSSGRLRRDFSVLPPGDIRNCLVAMSEDETLLTRLFQYRFSSGTGLKGHSLGNLFLTALTDLVGDFPTAVQHASDVLATCGRIYPSTAANVSLEAVLEDGARVKGETRISRSKSRIRKILLQPPNAQPLPQTLQALDEADLITIGPGSLFTSVIPNLLVKGIPEAIAASRALKIYFVNLMWQPGETTYFSAADHVQAILDHANDRLIDVVVVNSKPISTRLRKRYAAQEALPVENDLDRLRALGLKVVLRELAAEGPRVRHDPSALAEVTVHLAGEGHRRRRASGLPAKGKSRSKVLSISERSA